MYIALFVSDFWYYPKTCRFGLCFVNEVFVNEVCIFENLFLEKTLNPAFLIIIT